MATQEKQSNRSSTEPASEELLDRKSLNLPNLITLSRLILAFILFAMIYYEGLWISAAILFLVAASTDALDGYLARKYGQVTVLGRILDPFVDKIIICGAFVFLLERRLDSGITAWIVIIIIGREMFVTSLRSFLERQGIDFSARWSGKIKMVLQCAAVTASLLSLSPEPVFENTEFRMIRDVLIWSAVLVTVYSGLIYVYRAKVLLHEKVQG